jgi:hypothetical protein
MIRDGHFDVLDASKPNRAVGAVVIVGLVAHHRRGLGMGTCVLLNMIRRLGSREGNDLRSLSWYLYLEGHDQHGNGAMGTLPC